MKLKNITISNFKCFSENITINFPNSKNLFLLLGSNKDTEGMDSNEAGKSSFVEAIAWGLFGTPVNDQALANDIIRDGENYCEVILSIINRNDKVTIKRRRGNRDILEFSINGNLVNNKTDTPTAVQQSVNQYFNFPASAKEGMKDFLLTNFLSYSSVEKFASNSYSATDRFSFISRIFPALDYWLDCKQEATIQRKELNKTLDEFNGSIRTYETILEKTSLQELQSEIQRDTHKLEEIELEKDKLQKILYSYSEYTSKIKSKEMLMHDLKIKKEEFETSIAAHSNTIKNTQEAIQKHTEYIENKKQILKNIPDYDKNDIETSIDKLTSEISDKTAQGKVLTLEIKGLEVLSESPMACPECNSKLLISGKKLIHFDEDYHQNDLLTKKTNLKQVIIEVEELKNKLKKESEKKEALKQSESINESIEYIKKMLISEEESLKEITNMSMAYTKDMTKSIKQLEKEVGAFDIQYDADLELANEQYNNVILEEKLVLANKAKVREQIRNYKEIQDKLNEVIKKEKIIIEKIQDYKYWIDSFPKIRRYIINSIIPQIEEISNYYLSKMNVPFLIKIETETETASTNKIKEALNIIIIDKTTNTKTQFYKRSNGGRKRIGTAICFALQELKANNLSNWIEFKIFDEFLDNLDLTGIDTMFNLFSSGDNQIIITSHNQDLKDKFENVITIIKENGKSKIETNF